MYPETDVMPVVPDTKNLKLPKLLEESASDFVQLGLSKDLADLIAKSGKAAVFEIWVKRFKNLKPAFIAETMLPKLRELKRKYSIEIETITDDKLQEVFLHLDKGDLPKEALDDVLVEIAKTGTVDFARYKGMNDTELEKMLKKIAVENKDAPLGTLMGIAMKELRGKADGRKINDILKKVLK
jgi:glutamyl-tRNA(Gln) amidotransferase subunit E